MDENKYLKKVVNGITTNYVKCLRYESVEDFQHTPFFVEDVSGQPNTLIIKKDGSAYSSVTVEYSTDNVTWQTLGTTTTSGISTTIPANGRVYLRSNNSYWGSKTGSVVYGNWINSTSNFNVGGNIMSLCYGSNFTGDETTLPPVTSKNTRNFPKLLNHSKVVSAEHLILPALDISSNTECYRSMFEYCNFLTTPPALPAMTLGESCYSFMFYYTAITVAPDLMAHIPLGNSYWGMFQGCTYIGYITVGATEWVGSSGVGPSNRWLLDASATGTFTKPTNTTIPTGTNGIPSGWTVVNV